MIAIRCLTVLLPACLAVCSCSTDIPAMPAAPGTALSVAEVKTDSARRLAVLVEGAPQNEIFESYDAGGPVLWGKNFTRRLDFTGVAWDQDYNGTLITPEHVVMAAHYQRPAGSTFVFHDRRGKRHTRVMTGVVALKGVADVAVARLDRPLPAGVRPYRLPPPGIAADADWIGCPLVVTDRLRRVYFHEIAELRGVNVHMRHAAATPAHLKKMLKTGDSGSPSFLLVGGELVLMETHTWGGEGGGPSFASPAVQAGIADALQKLGGEARIRHVPLRGR